MTPGRRTSSTYFPRGSTAALSSPYDRKVSAARINLSRAILFRELLIDHGDDAKVVWFTHYGWKTGTSGSIDSSVQSDFLVSGLKRARAEWPWSGLMFGWDLLPRLSPDDSTGYALLDANGGATPAFGALGFRPGGKYDHRANRICANGFQSGRLCRQLGRSASQPADVQDDE